MARWDGFLRTTISVRALVGATSTIVIDHFGSIAPRASAIRRAGIGALPMSAPAFNYCAFPCRSGTESSPKSAGLHSCLVEQVVSPSNCRISGMLAKWSP